eukprot:1685788-Rhodomonas_salina.1
MKGSRDASAREIMKGAQMRQVNSADQHTDRPGSQRLVNSAFLTLLTASGSRLSPQRQQAALSPYISPPLAQPDLLAAPSPSSAPRSSSPRAPRAPRLRAAGPCVCARWCWEVCVVLCVVSWLERVRACSHPT